jgi:hypothetical protein
MFWLNYYEPLKWHASLFSRISVWNCWLSIESGPLLCAGQLVISVISAGAVGIWLSLGRSLPLLAWIANVALSCALPLFLAGIAGGPDADQEALTVRSILLQCVIAGLFWWRAARRLATHDWALPRPDVFVVVR